MTNKAYFHVKITISQTFSPIGGSQRMKIYKSLTINTLTSKTTKNRFLMLI